MSWQGCKNILCIRPDNMGDLIMSAPAFRALKESFGAKITVLTSSMAQSIVKHIPEIDDSIIFDLPWVKTESLPDVAVFNEAIAQLKSRNFDAAVIFTVYSQNPLPTAILPYLAGIPCILAYCRENPYHLITDWVPDQEPYERIKHQVERDLDLVASVGAVTKDNSLGLYVNDQLWTEISSSLLKKGFDTSKPWLVLHAGVSEKKRSYPIVLWAETAKMLINEGYQVLLTGSASELHLTNELQSLIGNGSFSAGGMFGLDEFICLIKHAPLLLSVNTGTIHIAAAVATKTVVLYARTNPQHTPWKVQCEVLEFEVPAELRSSNQVIAYVNEQVYAIPTPMPQPDDVLRAVKRLFTKPNLKDQLFGLTPA
jgi:lipopolysaccharide heptosyltransferase II